MCWNIEPNRNNRKNVNDIIVFNGSTRNFAKAQTFYFNFMPKQEKENNNNIWIYYYNYDTALKPVCAHIKRIEKKLHEFRKLFK